MNSITITVTPSESQGDIVFNFYAATRTFRIIKDTVRGGERTLAIHLEDLTYVKEVKPACYKTFNPTSHNYNKIDCIKNVRWATSWDLATAKSFVEMAYHLGATINTFNHD